MLVAIHTREEHVLLIDIVGLVALHLVAVGLVGCLLLLPLIDGSALLADRNTIVAVGLEQHLAGVGGSVE